MVCQNQILYLHYTYWYMHTYMIVCFHLIINNKNDYKILFIEIVTD